MHINAYRYKCKGSRGAAIGVNGGDPGTPGGGCKPQGHPVDRGKRKKSYNFLFFKSSLLIFFTFRITPLVFILRILISIVPRELPRAPGSFMRRWLYGGPKGVLGRILRSYRGNAGIGAGSPHKYRGESMGERQLRQLRVALRAGPSGEAR